LFCLNNYLATAVPCLEDEHAAHKQEHRHTHSLEAHVVDKRAKAQPEDVGIRGKVDRGRGLPAKLDDNGDEDDEEGDDSKHDKVNSRGHDPFVAQEEKVGPFEHLFALERHRRLDLHLALCDGVLHPVLGASNDLRLEVAVENNKQQKQKKETGTYPKVEREKEHANGPLHAATVEAGRVR